MKCLQVHDFSSLKTVPRAVDVENVTSNNAGKFIFKQYIIPKRANSQTLFRWGPNKKLFILLKNVDGLAESRRKVLWAKRCLILIQDFGNIFVCYADVLFQQ